LSDNPIKIKKKTKENKNSSHSFSDRVLRSLFARVQDSYARGEQKSYGSGSSFRTLLGSRVYVFEFPYRTSIASSVGGVINTSIVDSTGLAAAQYWSNAILLFDECKLMGVSVAVLPRNRYSKVSTTSCGLALIHDDDSTPTLTTYQDACIRNDVSLMNIDDGTIQNAPGPSWVSFSKPRDPTYLSDWQTTASLVVTGGLAFFAENLTASTTYADVLVKYKVALRIRA